MQNAGVPGAGKLDWRELSSLTQLQALDLSFTGTAHASLELLMPLAHSLRVLNLTSNRITSLPAAVAMFTRSVLSGCTSEGRYLEFRGVMVLFAQGR